MQYPSALRHRRAARRRRGPPPQKRWARAPGGAGEGGDALREEHPAGLHAPSGRSGPVAAPEGGGVSQSSSKNKPLERDAHGEAPPTEYGRVNMLMSEC